MFTTSKFLELLVESLILLGGILALFAMLTDNESLAFVALFVVSSPLILCIIFGSIYSKASEEQEQYKRKIKITNHYYDWKKLGF